MKASILAMLFLITLPLPAMAKNPYRLGGASTPQASSHNPYSTRSFGYQTNTTVYNPYGVRNGDPYKYAWKRRNGYTSIVVYPDLTGRVNIYNIKEPDHFDRARSNYFQQMYGPNGVYSSYR